MHKSITTVELSTEDVIWAIQIAQESISRWEGQRGYYNNRLESHFTGKLGELAVEKFLLAGNFKIDSHFRFSERENLADIVVKINRYKKVKRVEVKTWSEQYWQELGRCISVEQYLGLKNKSDLIIWCMVNEDEVKELTDFPKPINVNLAGWSDLADVLNAPVKKTGLGGMRKVENYQLAEADLRELSSLFI